MHQKARRYKVHSVCLTLLLGVCTSLPVAAGESLQRIRVDLGDYTFTPAQVTTRVNQTLELELVNIDGVTPHNFTLKHPEAGMDINVDVRAGKTEIVSVTPSTAGSYTFHCNKKLPFMKSHRKRGMEGTLLVVP